MTGTSGKWMRRRLRWLHTAHEAHAAGKATGEGETKDMRLQKG